MSLLSQKDTNSQIHGNVWTKSSSRTFLELRRENLEDFEPRQLLTKFVYELSFRKKGIEPIRQIAYHDVVYWLGYSSASRKNP